MITSGLGTLISQLNAINFYLFLLNHWEGGQSSIYLLMQFLSKISGYQGGNSQESRPGLHTVNLALWIILRFLGFREQRETPPIFI